MEIDFLFLYEGGNHFWKRVGWVFPRRNAMSIFQCSYIPRSLYPNCWRSSDVTDAITIGAFRPLPAASPR
jgi:hypothetical protein